MWGRGYFISVNYAVPCEVSSIPGPLPLIGSSDPQSLLRHLPPFLYLCRIPESPWVFYSGFENYDPGQSPLMGLAAHMQITHALTSSFQTSLLSSLSE